MLTSGCSADGRYDKNYTPVRVGATAMQQNPLKPV